MGRLRMTAKAERVFSQASSASSAHEAVLLIASLAGEFIEEEEKVVRYFASNGEPSKTKWVPCRRWDGRVGRNGSFGIDSTTQKAIQSLIPEDELMFVKVAGKKVIIEHVPYERGDGGFYPAHLRFRTILESK
jgi:hypothetical protein